MTWFKFLLCNFFLNTVDCCDVFPLSFSILFLYFSKLYLSIFLYYWADWKFGFVIFFFKTLLIATVFLRMIFFSPKLSFFLFYFLILSWLKITVTICKESTVTFFENYCSLLQYFSHMVFCIIFFKLSFSILFF